MDEKTKVVNRLEELGFDPLTGSKKQRVWASLKDVLDEKDCVDWLLLLVGEVGRTCILFLKASGLCICCIYFFTIVCLYNMYLLKKKHENRASFETFQPSERHNMW